MDRLTKKGTMSPSKAKPPQKKKDFQSPGVVFQPRVSQGMRAGIDQLVGLIAPTLGPLPHVVASEKIGGRHNLPERLDSGGLIARRIIQIPDRDADVGLMYLRHVLWKLQETEGDGTAAAAVMFKTIFDQGLRYIAAGGNPMGLRQYFEEGLHLIFAELDRQTTYLKGKQLLGGLAKTICYDDELAKMLGEIFDIIGAYGRLEVRKGAGQELIREYVEGMYWDSPLRSRGMANAEHGTRALLENTAILISDLDIDTPQQLIPLLQLALEHNIGQILLVSATLSEKAMGLLHTKSNQEKVFVAAVRIPGHTSTIQQNSLEDLAILTGGRALLKATGDRLESVRVADLGRARRAWADNIAFGIIGGRGDPRKLRGHITRLRQTYQNVSAADDRKHLLERLGKLTGGSATLYIGGSSPTHIEERVELAKRTAEALRGAMREGVVPGGGIALLACSPILEPCFVSAQDPDARAAYHILMQAVESPFRTLVTNAGFRPGKILAEMATAGQGAGFDVMTRKIGSMAEAGIYDSASVIKGAARAAIGGAALCLTTEAIIHIKNPSENLNT
jgi:chaperonin GroEL